MRRKRVRFDADVRRGPGGNIEMIVLNPWRDNPLAPTTVADSVGGIQRLPSGLVRVTFVQEIHTPGGATEFLATEHKLWTERNWLDSGDAFRWIMRDYERGMFTPPDGGHRRRTQ